MLHTAPTARHARLALAGTFLVTFALAACAGATVPSPAASIATPSTPQPTPTAVPGDPGGTAGPGGTGGAGGGTDPGAGAGGNVGSGILPPGMTFPLPQGPDQALLGEAKYLTPTQGLVNQRNASVQLVRAAITTDGRTFVDLRWYSGVAPCNALDSIKLAKDDVAKTVHLTVVEGSGQGDQMCIEIAELHAVAVDLGVLAAGTWTISAEGDAPAIQLDVP
jgi:hypothetical protein